MVYPSIFLVFGFGFILYKKLINNFKISGKKIFFKYQIAIRMIIWIVLWRYNQKFMYLQLNYKYNIQSSILFFKLRSK